MRLDKDLIPILWKSLDWCKWIYEVVQSDVCIKILWVLAAFSPVFSKSWVIEVYSRFINEFPITRFEAEWLRAFINSDFWKEKWDELVRLLNGKFKDATLFNDLFVTDGSDKSISIVKFIEYYNNLFKSSKIIDVDNIYEFNHDMEIPIAKIKKNHKFGLTDVEGDIVLSVEFDDIWKFDKYWIIKVKLWEKYGLYKYHEGNVIKLYDCIYDDIKAFNDDWQAIVWTGWKIWLIDIEWDYTIEPKYDYFSWFDNNWFWIIWNSFIDNWLDDTWTKQFSSCMKYGLVNLLWEIVLDPIYHSIWKFDNFWYCLVKKDDKWWLYTRTKKFHLQVTYDSISEFNSDGIAIVKKWKKYKLLYCDWTFRWWRFDEIWKFDKNWLAVVKKWKKYWIMNLYWYLQINCKYDELSSIDENWLIIVRKRASFWLRNQHDQEYIPTKFNSIKLYDHKYNIYLISKNWKLWFVSIDKINPDNNVFIAPTYHEISLFNNDWFAYTKYKWKIWLIHKDWHREFIPKYDKIEAFNQDGIALVWKWDKIWLINHNLQEISPIYDEISDWDNSWVFITRIWKRYWLHSFLWGRLKKAKFRSIISEKLPDWTCKYTLKWGFLSLWKVQKFVSNEMWELTVYVDTDDNSSEKTK